VTSVFIVGRSGRGRATMRERCDAAGLDVVGESPLWSDAMASAADALIAIDFESLPQGAGDGAQGPPVLVVSDEGAALRRIAATRGVGWGVVPVDVAPRELAAAVTAVSQGLAVAPSAVLAKAVRAAHVSADADAADVGERLTAREQDVLELVAEGRSNRAIARALGISEHTVKFHLASIYGKLGASTRTEAVRRGLRRGLITI
jgi:DNA-binding NarL/FixJ family response regulator